MTGGRLIAVVGPSGVGKDSVMAGISRAMPEIHQVRRVITRAPGLGGEDYDPVSEAEFAAMVEQGAFALHWQAHDLHYGIPAAVHDRLQAGADCMVNVSRKALVAAAAEFPRLVVLNITATPRTLAQRLAARGRETKAEIANRLAQAEKPLPGGLDIMHVSNDGPLSETVGRAAALLQRASV